MRALISYIVLSFVPAVAASSFDNAVARIYREKPHLKPQLEQKTVKSKRKQAAAIAQVLDYGALLYALGSIYKAHERIFSGSCPRNSGCIQKCMGWLYPVWLDSLTKKGRFCLESGQILVETLIIKSLVKLLLFTFSSDLADLLRRF